jgi:AraC-like DNA-binding protein
VGSDQNLLARIQGYIQQRLGDRGLSPRTIAAAHHISVRTLHRMFQGDGGGTVAAWVRARRLERCRHDLLDPRLRSWSVRAIAARWGFGDNAHFSRAFRAAYGTSPQTCREAHTVTTTLPAAWPSPR